MTGAERICPLCGQDNDCRHGEKNCWCMNYEFPQHVLDMVPEDKKQKACVCKSCLEKYSGPFLYQDKPKLKR